jgi:hypothetical protein
MFLSSLPLLSVMGEFKMIFYLRSYHAKEMNINPECDFPYGMFFKDMLLEPIFRK